VPAGSCEIETSINPSHQLARDRDLPNIMDAALQCAKSNDAALDLKGRWATCWDASEAEVPLEEESATQVDRAWMLPVRMR